MARETQADRPEPTVLRTIGRLILIPFALLIAALFSGFVLVTLGMEEITARTAETVDGDFAAFDQVSAILDFFWRIAGGLSLLPALLAVIVGEVGRIRSLLFYLVCGGLAIASAPMLSTFADTGAVAMPDVAVLQICATAGFLGGFVYWLLAGRTA